MVRYATLDDIDAIKLIALLSWKQAYEDLIPEEIQTQFLQDNYSYETIRQRMETSHFIVVTQENLDVGFAEYGYVNGRINVYAIYVLPSHQRLGLGKRMIQFIESHETSEEGIVMDLENGNYFGEAFCASLGFEKLSAKPDSMYGFPLKRVQMIRRNPKNEDA